MLPRRSSSAALAGAAGLLVTLAGVGPAIGNGRLVGPANVRLHPTDPDRMLVGMTFGLIESRDGETWRWVCEDAIGYGGEYDPDYAYHPTRDELWATTFDGLRVSRDGGCTWELIGAPFEPETWIGEVEIGPDGRVWAATSTGTATNDVFVSEDGVAFTSVGLVEATGWWESVKIAPSNPQVVYVSGYRMVPSEDGYVVRSTDGGATWSDPLPETGISIGHDPRSMVVGVSPVDPDVVFLRVLNVVEPQGDALYRSIDGGQTWAKVAQFNAPMRGFAISADGEKVFAGTAKLCDGADPEVPSGCLVRSLDGGANFEPAGYMPRLGPDNTPNTSNTLAFGPGGALYAAGSNGIDGWTLARSTDDADSFTKVFELKDIAGPLDCPAESIQGGCAATMWDNICAQNFICASALPDASIAEVDAGVPPPPPKDGGCCAVAPSPGAVLGGALLALLTALGVTRRRGTAPRRNPADPGV